jgi:uncharacterized protein HemY
MKRNNRQEEEQYATLRVAYQAEWRNLSGKVSRWRLLLEQVQGDHISVCEAEADTRLAEECYREARNAFAEYTYWSDVLSFKKNLQVQRRSMPKPASANLVSSCR